MLNMGLKKFWMSNWYYPSGKNLEKTSASNAYVETFNDHKIASLAREICQNSLDATQQNNQPVQVDFELLQININQIPGYKQLIEEIIPQAMLAWPYEVKTMLLIKKMKLILNQNKVSVLKISDYNTTGLEPHNWASLIEQVGSSVKKNDNSGGSFGIGKSAPFALSDLRMVFYNTLTLNNISQCIGVSKFVSYDLSNGETTQGTGYYGSKNKTPFNQTIPFDQNPRTKPGTDIYILGFDNQSFQTWQEEIKLAVLDNFLLSIQLNKLVVNINNICISKKTTNQIIKLIASNERLGKKYLDLLSYYEVLKNEKSHKVWLPAYQQYNIKDKEAYLLMYNAPVHNRKVLMTRKAGMKIFDQNRISGLLKFSGIFQATGDNINKILKELENPNHNQWSKDRAQDKQEAEKFLKYLRNFIKQAIINHYQEKVEHQIDAWGVSDFLPDDVNQLKSQHKKQRHLDEAKTKASLKVLENTKVSNTPIRGEIKGDIEDSEIVDAKLEENTTQGGVLNYAPILGAGIGENNFLKQGIDGTQAYNIDGNDIKIEQNITRKRIANINYRLIELAANLGLYNLIIYSQTKLEKLKLKISIIEDSGNKNNVKIIYASQSNSEYLKKHGNIIYLDSIKAKSWQRINIKINQQQRLKLEVEVYAYSK